MSYNNPNRSILKALAFTLPCGAYAIFSILDAMFWTLTGMSFFVGSGSEHGAARLLLTLVDGGFALWVFFWRMGE
jgi:hypothetical protein